MCTSENDEWRSGDYEVPADFPRERISGVVPGAQPKFVGTLYHGKYYLFGCTPPEVFDRWCMCEDLAMQLSARCLASKSGKRSHMTQKEILQQYFTRLVNMKWTTINEAHWIIKRAACIAGWNFPGVTE